MMQHSAAAYSINKTKYLLPNEFERLEKLLYDSLETDLRNCLLILTAIHTGGRAREILSVKKSDLNRYDESVYLSGLKGSNDREIPLRTWLFRKLWTYAETVEGPLLFPIGYHRLNQIWALYRPVPKKFHSLRHTFAIRLYDRTRDLRLVQTALGHRSITNTMVYADYVYKQTELRRLILEPLSPYLTASARISASVPRQ